MLQRTHTEIQRLERLRQCTELELELLEARRPLTPSQLGEQRELETCKLQLEHRIAWFEAILREHAGL